jgi:cytochrome c nitrite reductase small subunit
MFGSLRARLDSIFLSIPFGAWLLLAGLGGSIAGLGSFTFNYASGLSYLSDDPRACANCHVMREVYDGWNRAPHHAVAVCNDCHVPHDSLLSKYAVKAINGYRHSKAFTLNEIPDEIQIVPFDKAIVEANCVNCHADMVSQIVHLDSKDPVDCLTCHQGVGHGR